VDSRCELSNDRQMRFLLSAFSRACARNSDQIQEWTREMRSASQCQDLHRRLIWPHKESKRGALYAAGEDVEDAAQVIDGDVGNG